MSLVRPFILSSSDGAVRRLTLARAEQRNPLSMGMLNALYSELDAAMADASISVIVIAADGPVFCAGHDLKELTAAREAPDKGHAFFEETFAACERLMLAIATGPKPVLAEVQGLATAAGCQLAASCDIVVASTDASFATPGVDIGLFCSTPAIPLVRSMSAKRANLMLFSGEPISAQTALESGLVSEVLEASKLRGRVDTLATHIASKPLEVLTLGKATLVAQRELPVRDAYRVASDAMVNNAMQAEAVLGIATFLGRGRAKIL